MPPLDPVIAGCCVDVRGTLDLSPGVHFDNRPMPTNINVGPSGRMTLGERVYVNWGCDLNAELEVVIGSHSTIAPLCFVSDSNAHATEPGRPPRLEPVIIGRNVWLCRNVAVLPGVEIGDHTVVGTGSVVMSSLPDRVLARGNPAQVVRELTCDDDWVRGRG